MFGFDEYAWLIATYPYQFLASLAVVWAFARWLRRADLDAPMRTMVIGICLLNAGVVVHSFWFGLVRVMGWSIPVGWTMAILVPLKLTLIVAAYLHLHSFLVIRYGRMCEARCWLLWGFAGFLPFFLLVGLLA